MLENVEETVDGFKFVENAHHYFMVLAFIHVPYKERNGLASADQDLSTASQLKNSRQRMHFVHALFVLNDKC